jgi:hypothetical protein
MSDKPLLNRILLACSRGPVRLFRNNCGVGWTGKLERPARATTVTVFPGDVVLRKARPLHAGLAAGSGDLIGWRTVKITADMVGDEVALFVSLEAKAGKDKLRTAQRAWLEAVHGAGGIAAEVRSAEDAAAVLNLNGS